MISVDIIFLTFGEKKPNIILTVEDQLLFSLKFIDHFSFKTPHDAILMLNVDAYTSTSQTF